MSFGDTLRELSRNTVFEKMVWEKLKPELVRIASDRHAKGCHVRFIGFAKNFTGELTDIILGDGLTDYSYYEDAEWPYGTIYWGGTGASIKSGISDIYLEVTLIENNSIMIERKELTKIERKMGNTYIS